MTTPVTTEKRRFIEGSAIGGVVAFAVFAVILIVTGGHPDLLRHDIFGNFFDAQAHALMHGRMDVPAKELSFEGFAIGNKTHMVFGIWPALMRIPILAVAPSLYGRLTQLSMLGAFAVFIVALAALHWQIRQIVRPDRRCGRIEPALVILAISCGSTVLFMANRAIVYEEVLLWGIAFSVLAYDRIIALVRAPSLLRLATACLFSALAILSRVSVGLGPVVALGLVVAGQLVAGLANGRAPRFVGRLDWLGAGNAPRVRRVTWTSLCATCGVLPVLAYAAVNYARFGTPFGIPWTKYRIVAFNTQYQLALAKNHNTVFGAKFVPTTLLQYLRPDALAPSSLFPWITFPHFRASIIGGVSLVERTMATSLTASMPALVLLGVVGSIAAIRPAFAHERSAMFLRAPLVGGVFAVVPVFTIGYVANRYLGDFIPLLAVGAIAGLHALLRRREHSGQRKTANALLVIAIVLAIFGVWVNVALVLEYQRLADPMTLRQRTEMVAFQYDIDRVFGGRPRDVAFVPVLPARPAKPFTSAIVGSCDAMYWSDGQQWWELEGKPAAGVFRLRVEFPSHLGRDWQPLLVTGAGGDMAVGTRRSHGDVQLGIGLIGSDRALHWLPGIAIDSVRAADMEIVVSKPRKDVSVLMNGKNVLEIALPAVPVVAPYRLGTARTPGIAQQFGGKVTLLQPDLRLCRALLKREGAGQYGRS